jgi:hypothetical protein
VWYKQMIMRTLTSLLSIVVLATPLVAQNAPIPQDLPLELRKTSDAVRRKVEQQLPQPLPQNVPWPRSNQRLEYRGLLDRLGLTSRPALANEVRVNVRSVEDRIAALEAKVDLLQSELEAQNALIKQLMELLDRQQKKN